MAEKPPTLALVRIVLLGNRNQVYAVYFNKCGQS